MRGIDYLVFDVNFRLHVEPNSHVVKKTFFIIQALGKAEDETDVMAADLVKAEQKAELAEFDESIPWNEREAEQKREEEEMTRAEQELSMLDKEVCRFIDNPLVLQN